MSNVGFWQLFRLQCRLGFWAFLSRYTPLYPKCRQKASAGFCDQRPEILRIHWPWRQVRRKLFLEGRNVYCYCLVCCNIISVLWCPDLSLPGQGHISAQAKLLAERHNSRLPIRDPHREPGGIPVFSVPVNRKREPRSPQTPFTHLNHPEDFPGGELRHIARLPVDLGRRVAGSGVPVFAEEHEKIKPLRPTTSRNT
jgi:hypothetical protein